MHAVSVGYSGGTSEHPTYPQVCTGTTGHAEVVEVQYDPAVVPLERLFSVFWRLHDPTAPRSSQYRSAIFCRTPRQLQAARASAERLAVGARLRRPVVTEIAMAGPYWRAEEYHQRYYEKMRAKRAVR